LIFLIHVWCSFWLSISQENTLLLNVNFHKSTCIFTMHKNWFPSCKLNNHVLLTYGIGSWFFITSFASNDCIIAHNLMQWWSMSLINDERKGPYVILSMLNFSIIIHMTWICAMEILHTNYWFIPHYQKIIIWLLICFNKLVFPSESRLHVLYCDLEISLPLFWSFFF
jgi:hypothetical protein